MVLAVSLNFEEEASLPHIAKADEMLDLLFKHEDDRHFAVAIDRETGALDVIEDFVVPTGPDLALLVQAPDHDGSLTLNLATILKTSKSRHLVVRIREMGHECVTIGVRQWKHAFTTLAVLVGLMGCTTM